MKRYIAPVAVALAILASFAYGQSLINRLEGGTEMEVLSGGTVDMQAGSTLSLAGTVVFTPTDTTPTATVGTLYFDTSCAAFLYHDGTQWLQITYNTPPVGPG